MKKRIILFCIAIVVVIFIIVYIIIQFNSKSDDSSKRIFNISRDEVTLIQIQSGDTGEFIDFSGEQEIDDFVQNLNNLCYEFSREEEPMSRVGWAYRIIIHSVNDYGDYEFSDSSILVDDVWYYFPEPSTFLSDLIALYD